MSALMKTVIISAVITTTPRTIAATVLFAAATVAAGCSTEPPVAAPGGDCPVAPVDVVVSVDQWGDIVTDLGGDCARVTTLLAGSSLDPHDYEPTPADATKFSTARLVVVNGGHYDEWAAKLAAGSAPDAPVISAVDHAEANPHAWYDPAAVVALADAVTAKLSTLAPQAASYFEQRRTAFGQELAPYDAKIAAIKAAISGYSGKSYAATESVFDDMAAAVGLQNRTPAGYQASAGNETEPSPADLDAFLKLLAGNGVDVLIYNIQTEGSLPQRLRSAAEVAGVPVVEVTETPAPGTTSFEAWQMGQLTALAGALGV